MNAKSLIGMTVFAIEGGKNLGSVERLLFSPEELRVTSVVVTPPVGMMDEPEPQKLLPSEKLHGIGQDAITVDSESLLDITADGELPAGSVAFDQIEKEKVITESGDDVGELESIEFNENDFRLDFLEVGRGFLSGNSLITVDNLVSVGEDVIVVKDAVLDQQTGLDREEESLDEELTDEQVVTEDEDDEGTTRKIFR